MTENLPARREQVQVDLAKPLASLDEAMRVAEVLSRSDLIPSSLYGKPANLLHVLLTGQSLGLHWLESPRVIYSPGRGQIGMRGAFLLSRLRQAGHTYTFENGDDYCTFTLKRGDTKEEFAVTYTIGDAIRARLVALDGDGNLRARSPQGNPMSWETRPRTMLRWRAVAEACNFYAPEVALGFVIEGADEKDDAAPEVELRPAAGAVQPAEVVDEASAEAVREAGRATEEQLRILDERMRHEDADETIRAAGVDPVTLREDPEWTEPPEVAEAVRQVAEAVERDLADHGIEPDPPEDEPPADKAKGQVLAERFESLGWHPRRHRADMVRASSVYLRRPVSGSRDMSTAEIMALTNELSRIERSYPTPSHPVALADKVEEWRQAWEREDPEGYGRYSQ